MNFRKPAHLFIPYSGRPAPTVRETRLIRDLTMPRKDWREYDRPPVERVQGRTRLGAV